MKVCPPSELPLLSEIVENLGNFFHYKPFLLMGIIKNPPGNFDIAIKMELNERGEKREGARGRVE